MKEIIIQQKHRNSDVIDTFVVKVDDEVYEWVSGFRWCMSSGRCNNHYPVRWRTLIDGPGSRHVCMHRSIWEHTHGPIPPKMQVDHINGDRLDNRLYNLRVVSNRENQQNQQIHREGRLPGSHLERGRWRARIRIGGVKKHLGCFNTEQEAHQAYLKALTELEQTTAQPEERAS